MRKKNKRRKHEKKWERKQKKKINNEKHRETPRENEDWDKGGKTKRIWVNWCGRSSCFQIETAIRLWFLYLLSMVSISSNLSLYILLSSSLYLLSLLSQPSRFGQSCPAFHGCPRRPSTWQIWKATSVDLTTVETAIKWIESLSKWDCNQMNQLSK